MLVGLFGWRGVFWFNMPFGVLCIAVTLLVVEDSADPGGRRVDLAGQALLALTLAAGAYAVIEGNDLGWTSAPILALFVLAAAAGLGFLAVERAGASPAVRLDLFGDPTFTGANAVAFAINFGVFAIFFFLSLFLQLIATYSAFQAAAHFAPMTLAMIVAAPLTGRLVARVGPRPPMVAGLVLAATGMLLTDAVLSPRVGFGQLGWSLPLIGIGFGMVLAPMTSAVMTSAPRERSGMAAATTNASRQVGALVGVAVLGALVDGRLTGQLTDELRRLGLPPNFQRLVLDAVTHGTSPSSGRGAGGGGGLVAKVIATAENAFVAGLHTALVTGAVVLLAAALLALLTVRGPARPGHGGAPPGYGKRRIIGRNRGRGRGVTRRTGASVPVPSAPP
ncbi:MAG TPA: MFS transporter [Frankiaceae bacterium]|nr:MFS transporter [Frankiaceae bacterium]